jgi:hypothetical protein
MPGYKFKAVDAMITNFHLPPTLIMLVSAFAGERILEAYDGKESNTGFIPWRRHAYIMSFISFNLQRLPHQPQVPVFQPFPSLPGRGPVATAGSR